MPDLTDQILPDYAVPSAIMVAHYDCDLREILEEIASRVSKYCGVILLSHDESYTQKFINTQEYSDHFTIVKAPYDSPWLRDRSPIAIQTKTGIRWCVPKLLPMDRPLDDILFSRICAAQTTPSPLEDLPQGNIIAANDGLVLMTRHVLKENGVELADLERLKPQLGVQKWLIFSGFYKEMTGHADIHVRVLENDVFAVAWNLSVKQDRQKTSRLIKKIHAYNPKAHILKIPTRSYGRQYACPLNWIQIGRHIIAPEYDLTANEDVETIKQDLTSLGFTAEFMKSPTLELGGSLHCLTASVFV